MELIAVIFTLLSIILTVKNNIWCWSVGIIGSIFYGIIFYQNRIYGNTFLQGVFIIQSIIGWYHWKDKERHIIKYLTNSQRIVVSIITVIEMIFLYFILKLAANDESPLFDSITTILSIVGIALLTFRKIDNWIYWIVADIIFIYFFYTKGLYLSSLLYFVFLILAILGLFQWRKDIKRA